MCSNFSPWLLAIPNLFHFKTIHIKITPSIFFRFFLYGWLVDNQSNFIPFGFWFHTIHVSLSAYYRFFEWIEAISCETLLDLISHRGFLTQILHLVWRFDWNPLCAFLFEFFFWVNGNFRIFHCHREQHHILLYRSNFFHQHGSNCVIKLFLNELCFAFALIENEL